MPASSVSAALSWGVYIAASMTLVGAFSQPLSGEMHASYAHSLRSLADGLATEICSMQEGMTLQLTYNSAVPNTVVIAKGHEIKAVSGGLEAVKWCILDVPWVQLEPGKRYSITLESGRLQIG